MDIAFVIIMVVFALLAGCRKPEDEELHCNCCGIKYIAKRRRLSTAYEDDELNYEILCDYCFSDREEMIAEMWKDYYSGVL